MVMQGPYMCVQETKSYAILKGSGFVIEHNRYEDMTFVTHQETIKSQVIV